MKRIFASFVRYFWHSAAGYTFWGSYAPEEMLSVRHSFVINGTTMLTFLLRPVDHPRFRFAEAY